MKHLTVRFDDDVYMRAKRQADAKGLSLNAYLQSLIPAGETSIKDKPSREQVIREKADTILKEKGRNPTMSELTRDTELGYDQVWRIAKKLGITTLRPKEIAKIQKREAMEREALPALLNFMEEPSTGRFTITHGQDRCSVNFGKLAIEMPRDYDFGDPSLLRVVKSRVTQIVLKYDEGRELIYRLSQKQDD